MTVKLSKQALLHILPICSRLTPVALSLIASTYACGQTVQNRYSAPNPYSVQVNPVYTYPSGTPSVQITPPTVRSYEVHPGYYAPPPQPAMRYAPQTAPAGTVYEVIPPRRPQTAVQGSPYLSPQIVPPARAPGSNGPNIQPSVAPKPIAPDRPNFADVQEVGRGLGTPGLITPGSVQRMEQSGLVVEDFRPPQPQPENFSLEGLPPEARRAFYDQLQLPDGGRVMSARVLSTESAPPVLEPADPMPSDIAPSREPHSVLPAPQPIAPALPQLEPNPIQEALPEAKQPEPTSRSVPTLSPPEPLPDSATAPAPTAPVLNAPVPTAPVPSVKPEAVELEFAVEKSPSIEERFAKQHAEMQTLLQKLTEQNAALASKLMEATDRLSKLEQSNAELGKKLEDASKWKETESETSKTDKQEAAPSGKDKAPEKKGKKKPKERIEV